ncbi:efflux RND transporter periplasmic adaptor subunit [Acidithiobacillus sp. IBUN Pt1247-S3]|uniref:efflux RND transporter periplasmic adaptor subunit n=1 Tax=Acidithiobacillus sp. IBUN Pt1247-S3 TaxID=3166642 RepID=UPI0034E3C7D5
MKLPALQRRTLALLAVIVLLLLLLGYVALRSGPLAPVTVTVATVQKQALKPSLFGIGTIQARYTYQIGPTAAGRLKHLDVHVGDTVKAGQVIGEMDPVDLDQRITAQQATIQAGTASVRQAEAKRVYAQTQAQRYAQLLAVHSTSEETLASKRQDLAVADGALAAARDDLARQRADLQALRAQNTNLHLIAPVDGLVAARYIDPGSTVLAGEAVVEVINPNSLWVDTRFDQISATGLAAGLPAHIVLRSRQDQTLPGRVLRVDPLADAVTEETLAKMVFDKLPTPLPPVGELAEVTVELPALPAAPVIPNAALREVDSQRGVWTLNADKLAFVSVVLGRSDLHGHVQVLQGLKAGDHVVVYSEKALHRGSNIHVVDHIPGVAQ